MKTLTLTIGQFKTPQKYLKEIKKTRSVSSYGEQIIAKIPISPKKKKVVVALLTFADLELSEIQTTQQIKDAALKKGYGLPDAEIGLALALQEQQIGDCWFTLHDPIKDSDGDPRVLHADRDGSGPWVGAYWVRPDAQWRGVGAFAFLVPASKSSILDSSALSLETKNLELRVERLEKILESVAKILSTL